MNKAADEGVRLARSGAVADRDGPHIVFRNQRLQRTLGAGNVVLRRKGIDHIVTQEFAGVVHHGDFAAGTDAGVDSKHGKLPGGRREQQILQIFAKYLNRIGVGAPLKLQTNFRSDGTAEQPLPGVFRRQVQMGSPIAGLFVDLALDDVQRPLRIQLDYESTERSQLSPRRMASIRCEGICFTGSR